MNEGEKLEAKTTNIIINNKYSITKSYFSLGQIEKQVFNVFVNAGCKVLILKMSQTASALNLISFKLLKTIGHYKLYEKYYFAIECV